MSTLLVLIEFLPLVIIIIIWDLASEKPHAQEHTRPIGPGRKKLKSVGGCPPAGAEGPRGEDQLPRRHNWRNPEGRENFVPKDRANEGGGVVDEGRSGVRTHRSRFRSGSSMMMFGGSLSRTAVESSSSSDAKTTALGIIFKETSWEKSLGADRTYSV